MSRSQPAKHFGDLLPMPLPESPKPPMVPRTRASTRRHPRCVRLRNAAAESTCAVNELAGFTDRSAWPSAPLNEAQVSAQQLIHDLRCQRSWPRGSVVRPRAALKKLLRQSPAYGGSTGSLAPYLEGMVPIPSDQGDPCVLSEILDPVNRHLLENFESLMMLSPDQRDLVVEDTLNGSESYMDPTLESDPRAWASFVHQLYRANVIIFISDPRVQIGAFFRIKKEWEATLYRGCSTCEPSLSPTS